MSSGEDNGGADAGDAYDGGHNAEYDQSEAGGDPENEADNENYDGKKKLKMYKCLILDIIPVIFQTQIAKKINMVQ